MRRCRQRIADSKQRQAGGQTSRKTRDKHNETLREGGRQRKAETETEKGGETDRDR